MFFVRTKELHRADREPDADDDACPPEPRRQRRALRDADNDQEGPDAGEQVAEVLTDPEPEVLVEGAEDDGVRLSLLRR